LSEDEEEMAINPIVAQIEADLRETAAARLGTIGRIAAGYDNTSERLLGFLLSLSYEEMRIVTCDPWKRKCGGVPRNSFVIVKVNPNLVAQTMLSLLHGLSSVA
jgi:hypothetical protein